MDDTDGGMVPLSELNRRLNLPKLFKLPTDEGNVPRSAFWLMSSSHSEVRRPRESGIVPERPLFAKMSAESMPP
jgi:hypothetical protein